MVLKQNAEHESGEMSGNQTGYGDYLTDYSDQWDLVLKYGGELILSGFCFISFFVWSS